MACLSLGIMLAFREAALNFYELDGINTKLIDMSLITLNDYSVSGWITKSVWLKHKQDYPDHNPTLTFMRHLWEDIEK